MPAPATFQTDLVVPSELAEVRRIQGDVKDALAAAAYSDNELFSVELALEEALVNAIKHGNQLDPDRKVRVAYSITPERFDIRIEDEGDGFDPCDVPDPTLPENLARPCGRGLLLIRSFMNDVTYHGRGNIVTMTKLREAVPAQ
jgi:serine/threonine-protein kinase RsbW